ncbi:Wzz/FepE/Etk N-terminal domain-containing protein [Vibrio harveyi]|uniref:Wzz/FepE/Etk N-terminal domain-containing protein n=1 Tax=Vibrio harveyi TaxID=669 RepID=UPI001A32640B|nr:LPS O-antigen length regulator [Vibrio parahaemolyticus]
MESQKEPHTNHLPYPPQSPPFADEIDLCGLLKALWKGKWIIIITTFIFTTGAVVYSLSLPNIYKADALLAPAESSGGGGLSSMTGQLGGLAALAGVNLGGRESSKAELAVQVLESRQFIDSFISRHNLLVPLIASKGWDLNNNELLINEDLYDDEKAVWLRKPKGLRGASPSAQEAYEVFSKNVLTVNQDKDTGLYSLAVKHYSPYIAQQWVNWLIEDINNVMRARAIAETTQNLSYLNTQLNNTSVAEMQSTFYKLIEEQTKSLMLAEVQEEFVFRVIDPAVIPEIKVAPNRGVICILGMLIGIFIGSIITLVRSYLKN